MRRRRRETGNPLTGYSFDRGQDLHSAGADVEDHHTFDLGVDELIVSARVVFERGRAVLNLFEHLHVVDGEVHRRKYGYHVTLDERSFRYDRDPVHTDMPEHKHPTGDERRVPWSRVTLQDVVDEILDLLEQTREIENADDLPSDARVDSPRSQHPE